MLYSLVPLLLSVDRPDLGEIGFVELLGVGEGRFWLTTFGNKLGVTFLIFVLSIFKML